MRSLYYIFLLSFLLIACTTKKDPSHNRITTGDTVTPSLHSKIVVHRTEIKKLLDSPDTKNIHRDLWPVKTPPVLPGSIFPNHRIVAFYGNLDSRYMGILGEYPHAVVIKKLRAAVNAWNQADSDTKVIPALQLIAVSAQDHPGPDGKYRLRMPFSMIDTVLAWAKPVNALTILDIQVGQSTVEAEIPRLKRFLKMPQVELAIDPEFSMKDGYVPGTRIGHFNASDINYCIQYLKQLVDSFHLPPKVLIVHRFTQDMIRNYKDIHLCSEVQVVIDMDGWGSQYLKKNTYDNFIYPEPVEYTGFKLFFKNDNLDGHEMMTPREVLKLYPQPLYIQYE